jgi:hypothetical protein
VSHRKTLLCYSQTKYTMTAWREQVFLRQQQNQYWFSWTAYKCETSLICNKTFSIISNMMQHSAFQKESAFVFRWKH